MDVPSDVSIRNGSHCGENSPTNPSLMELPLAFSNVYVLGTCDHPSLCLVLALLTPKSYLGWSDDMMNNLTAKGKEGFITRSLLKLASGDAEFKLWVNNDVMAK